MLGITEDGFEPPQVEGEIYVNEDGGVVITGFTWANQRQQNHTILQAQLLVQSSDHRKHGEYRS